MMRLVAPVKPSRVVSGWWDARTYRGGFHEGLDLTVPIGTAVRAAGDGEVIRVDSVDDSLAGRWVAIRHEGGWISRYLHLSAVATSIGKQVKSGELVGRSGQSSTGLSPPHLHFELRLPAERLYPEYVSRFGTPTTGFGRSLGAIGIAVPSEPILPVDAYDEGVRQDAINHGIPLAAAQPPAPVPGSSGGGIDLHGLEGLHDRVIGAVVPMLLVGGLLVLWALE
jgi:murein DD-endopeptidase MepM/ murein hydrolase activator NlpD